MDEYLSLLKFHFENHRNEQLAGPMKKYMKDLFPFLGIKKPERAKLMRTFFQQSGILQRPIQIEFIKNLWEQEEREYQYADWII